MKKKFFLQDGWKIIWNADRLAAILIAILKGLLALVPAMQTIVVARFIDRVITVHGNAIHDSTAIKLVIAIVSLIGFTWIGKSLVDLFEKHLVMRLRIRFKPLLVKKISNLNYANMENGNLRDQINRVNQDIEEKICRAYMELTNLAELVIKVSAILIIMFLQVWWAALLIIAVSIPCFYVAVKSGQEQYDAEKEVSRINRVNEYYNEILKSRDYVDERTIFGFAPEIMERFSEKYEDARKYKTKVKLKWYIRMKRNSMITVLVSAALITVLVPLTLQGSLTLGMFMALINAIFSIIQNMSWDLIWAIDSVTEHNEFFRELVEVSTLPEDEMIADEKVRLKDFNILEFRDVSFCYPGTENYILKNLSFKIQKGMKYAFVGSNGAGKSTIIKLINGLYQNYEGEILLDGVDISKYDRRFIATVFQDFARYPISVSENITIGLEEKVEDTLVQKVIEEIELTQTVEKMEHGIHTVLGKYQKGSLDISGGEWQKIALARCILAKALIKILDEPTSAMDPIYERSIYEKFRKISQDKTVILISHRLASVKMADFIFVLDGGSVAESGTHEELLLENNLYAKMYQEQAKWYVEGEV